MDNSGYVTLNRQAGLMREMQLIANNIANANTTGFRREGTLFAEHIAALGPREESLSMADAAVRLVDLAQGGIEQTRGAYDLAIQGEGFFMVQAPQGQLLTRAGAFSADAEGNLVTMDGYPVLDAGAAPIALPAGAKNIAIGADGTISADGVISGQIGLFMPSDVKDLMAAGGTLYEAKSGTVPAEGAQLLQGFLEESNVSPVGELTRMIEVQRAYEQGQKFLDNEHERIRGVIRTITRSS